jgi:broad specificity phosphatase PhoE
MRKIQLEIDLLRHGLSESNKVKKYSNVIDEPLDKLAFGEISNIKEYFDNINYDMVFSSPYKRCLETALYLIRDNTVAIKIENSIREMELGPWNGLTPKEIEIKYPIEWEIWKSKPDKLRLPERETIHEVRQRVISWLIPLINSIECGHILIVTHVVVIRVILSYYLGIPLSNIRDIEIDNLKTFKLQFINLKPLIWELHMPYK